MNTTREHKNEEGFKMVNSSMMFDSNGLSHNKPDLMKIKNHSHWTDSRPDWILYTVPASAFMIGVVLFAFICKTQRHKRKHAEKRSNANGHKSQFKNTVSMQGYTESKNTNTKDETLSYENVEAAIYTNQEKVTYYVSADQDYLCPDLMGDKEEAKLDVHHHTLQRPQNLTDTDGESYENMEECFYAQPRKRSQQLKHTTEEGDYINPDETEKQDVTVDHTDTESYELMVGSDCKHFTEAHEITEDDYINPDGDGRQDLTLDHTDTESYELMADCHCKHLTADTDDSYEQMNGIPVSF